MILVGIGKCQVYHMIPVWHWEILVGLGPHQAYQMILVGLGNCQGWAEDERGSLGKAMTSKEDKI